MHRDLKPENVIVTEDGLPVLVDFGLVSQGGQVSREEIALRTGIEGTLAYIAPEQISGR